MDDLALLSGTRYQLRYRVRGSSTPGGSEFTTISETVGPAVFEGQPAIEITTSQTEGAFTSTSRVYLEKEGLTVRFHGGTSRSRLAGDSFDTRTVNASAARFRYDLAAGESFAQSYSGTSATASDRFSSELRETFSVEERIGFLGIESVTVPAGVFEACRFTIEETLAMRGATAEVSRVTKWIAVGSGVMVRTESVPVGSGEVTTTIELVSGQRNGLPIVPLR